MPPPSRTALPPPAQDDEQERATLIADILAYFLPGKVEGEELLALIDQEEEPLLAELEH